MSDQNASTNKYLNWTAIAVLIIGIIFGLFTLSAPAGVWLGLWEFGQGFGILGIAVPFSPWLALACILASIAIGIIARQKKVQNTGKLLSFALVGTLLTVIAWYIPSIYGARLSYPPIHDVSTDVDNPPEYVAAVPLRADAVNTMEYGAQPPMTPEENAQLQREAFPDLVPQLIDASPQEVFDRALAALETMGLEIIAAVPEEGRIEAVATTFWFRFKDDVVIRIRPQGEQTLVDARSLSRVGRGDAGANGLRLQEFFSLL